MEKEFVPYALALRLKALGFDEPCFGYYHIDLEEDKVLLFDDYEYFMEGIEFSCNAPTFSQVFRWFRENHRMFHEVFIDTEPTVEEPDKLEFSFLILHMVGTEHMHTDKKQRYTTYEEAELACLNKLIEIVEGAEAKTINI